MFGAKRILYAEKATPEGYSPWFLAHNNWTATKGGNWFNKIYADTIEEMWVTADYNMYHDGTTRVTFAKNRNNGYVFLGLYKPFAIEEKILTEVLIDKKGNIIKNVGDKIWVKKYKLINNIYEN